MTDVKPYAELLKKAEDAIQMPCGCGIGKIIGIIFIPIPDAEGNITEDAEFEVVEPKQLPAPAKLLT